MTTIQHLHTFAGEKVENSRVGKLLVNETEFFSDKSLSILRKGNLISFQVTKQEFAFQNICEAYVFREKEHNSAFIVTLPRDFNICEETLVITQCPHSL